MKNSTILAYILGLNNISFLYNLSRINYMKYFIRTLAITSNKINNDNNFNNINFNNN